MFAPVRWFVRRALAYLARPLLGLRYRVEIRGLDAVRAKGRHGILFLPNHSALIDPAVIVAWLHPSFDMRPLADEHQVGRTVFGYIALLYGSRILPNLERSGAEARNRTRQALRDIAEGLKAGENILLYPSGRLKRQMLEDIGSASGTETIVKAVPEARVVLIRQNGLWGSSFSIGRTGEMPDIGTAVAQGVKHLLLNGVFFMPRRRITVDIVEPDDFPRTGTRSEINRYLERFYNEGALPNTYVPYGFWEKGGRHVLPDPVQVRQSADASGVSPATRDLVLAHVAEISGRRDASVDHQLARDLGLDSLAAAELVAWIQAEFGFSVDSPESLQTVADVVLAAGGQGVSERPLDLKPIPADWFSAAGNGALLAVPDGDTIPEVFLKQAAARAAQPLFADQTAGVRTYRDVVTAVYVLKPILERLPGEYVGIMMPASVAATLFILSAMFAGKTPVMVNWTTGVRTVRHSLDLLGVTTVVTARALVAKLGSTGIDMTEVEGSFLYVEDVLKGITPMAKAGAALHARLSLASLSRLRPRDEAVVLFTSGSESLPKAVPLTHGNLLANMRDALQMGRLVEQDIVLGFLPPFHSFGMNLTVMLPFCVGLRTVFYPNPTESSVLARLTEAYRATVLFGTPTFLGGIARVATDRQLATMRLAVTGAEKCPDALHATLRRRWPSLIVLEGYGITECSPVVSVNPMDAPIPGSIGRLLPAVEGVVVDIDGKRRAAPDETGILLVRGPSIFGGYLHYDGESPFVEFEGRSWYRTGDLVSMTADGVLYFKGRLKRFIKLGGEMISLPAIEAVLLRHAGDAEDGPPLAVEAIGSGEHPDIVLFTTRPADRAQINALLKAEGLSPLHNVKRVIEVGAIPLLGTGKTDYRALRNTYGSAA
jgi:acyl-CoA synthetase (AMP-forming)/AMP-acid ligase II/1-acyl-sn-glycerol-3-phosphate acyltransferase/acyl carrier protein